MLHSRHSFAWFVCVGGGGLRNCPVFSHSEDHLVGGRCVRLPMPGVLAPCGGAAVSCMWVWVLLQLCAAVVWGQRLTWRTLGGPEGTEMCEQKWAI